MHNPKIIQKEMCFCADEAAFFINLQVSSRVIYIKQDILYLMQLMVSFGAFASNIMDGLHNNAKSYRGRCVIESPIGRAPAVWGKDRLISVFCPG